MAKLFWITLVIALLAITTSVYQYYQNKAIQSSAVDKYEPQIKSLELRNDSLLTNEVKNKKKVLVYEQTIDSLESLKPTVITKYIKVYEKIDASNADAVVDEYKLVFSNEGINQ